MNSAPDGPRPCCCGHSIEEHGNDPTWPLATECSECSCCMYDPDGGEDPTEGRP